MNAAQQQIGGEFHALTQLEKGQKYTLLTQGFLGVVAIQIILYEVRVGPWAQYSESVELIFKPKAKRNLRGLRFHGRESCVVWQGWIEVDTDPFRASEKSLDGVTIQQSRYLSFDSRYFTDAIASVSAAPFFSNVHEFITNLQGK